MERMYLRVATWLAFFFSFIPFFWTQVEQYFNCYMEQFFFLNFNMKIFARTEVILFVLKVSKKSLKNGN